MELMDKMMMKDRGLEYSVKGDMTIRQCHWHTFMGLISLLYIRRQLRLKSVF
jgi:hypothetical protein